MATIRDVLPGVAALLLGASTASADASAPRPSAPREITCGAPEWTAIRRAIATFCEPSTNEGCGAVRAGFRRCRPGPVLSRVAEGIYAGSASGWEVRLLRDQRGWRVESIEPEKDCDCGLPRGPVEPPASSG